MTGYAVFAVLFASGVGFAAPGWEGKLDAPAWPDVVPQYRDLRTLPACQVRGAYFRGSFVTAADDKGGKPGRCYFLRRTFSLKQKPVAAWLQGTADKSGTFRLNGEVAFEPQWTLTMTTIHWMTPNARVEKFLRAGENTLEIEYKTPHEWAGGALVELFVRYADGSFERIDSDEKFESSADGKAWTGAVCSDPPPAAPRARKLNYFDLERPQELLCGGPERKQVRGGERINLVYTYRGEAPKGEFEAIVNLLHAKKLCWGEYVRLGPDNVRVNADGTWRLEVPFEVPLYFSSGKYEVLLTSNSICQLGRTAGGELDIARVALDSRFSAPVETEMRMTDGTPVLCLNGKPFPLLWGISYYHRRPDYVHRIGDMPYTAVTVAPWYLEWHPHLGKFNFVELDRHAEDTRRQHPDAYFIFSFVLYPPYDFAKEYPDDMAKDDAGDTTPVGRFSWSYSSQRARDEMKDAIDRAIRHVESSPYANRVIGYRFATGFGTEWLGWQTNGRHVYDYSKPSVDGYLRFAKENYPELADPHVPDLAERLALDAPNDILWDRAKHLNVLAYMEYYSLRVAKNALEMCGQMKETLAALGRKKVVGTYYGYTYHLNDRGGNQQRAHFALREILEHNDGRIDFLNSPQSYYQRTIGDMFGPMHPFSTLDRAGIKSIIEDDTRTSVRTRPYWSAEYDQLHTTEQDIGVIRRNGASCLCRCTYPFFYALQSGQDFDGPVFADLGAALRSTLEFSLEKGVRRHADVAFVASERSVTATPHQSRRAGFTGRWIQSFDHEGHVVRKPEQVMAFCGEVFRLAHTRFARSGTPVDYLLAEDLKHRPGDYRLYVFLNLFTYDEETRLAVEKLRARGATLLWLYAPGYLKDNTLDAMKALTGIEFAAMEKPGLAGVTMKEDGRFMGSPNEEVARRFYPVKPDVTLGVYEDGRPGVAAVKLGKSVSIFSGVWQLDQKFISKIVDKAGAHVFSESGDPVEANDAFVMLHARFPGEKTIRLPRKATVVDVFERKLVGRDIDVIAFDAALHSTHFFYFGDDADELLAKLKRDFK